MNFLLKVMLVSSLVMLPLSCSQQNKFVSDMSLSESLRHDPLQNPAHATPFQAEQGGVKYTVTPEFDYDLYGLVVSYQHHDGDRMLHRLWNDHLNVADVCVVWGSNAQDLDLNEFEFWNGQFTCFFRTDDQLAWQRFDQRKISNNHLITEDPKLRAAISGLQIGDQIHLTGYLANYANGEGFFRATSKVRSDTGNGACETIYVKSFQVIDSMRNMWRWLFSGSIWSLLGSLLMWVIGVGKGWF